MTPFIALILFNQVLSLNNNRLIYSPDERLSEHQSKQISLVISDTIYRSGSRQNHALAVNGSFPPKFIMASTGNPTTLIFTNYTPYELTIEVPAPMNAAGKSIKQKLLSQQALSISLNVKKAGINSYRIHRFEQRGPATTGSVIVEYPKTQ